MGLKIEGQRSVLHIPKNRIKINSELRGSILSRQPTAKVKNSAANTVEVILTCFRRKITKTIRAQGSGTKETIVPEPIWQDFRKSAFISDGIQDRIDFSFIIPATAQPTDPDDKRGVFWKLSVQGKKFKDTYSIIIDGNEDQKPIPDKSYTANQLMEIAKVQKIQISDSEGIVFPIGRFLFRNLFPLAIGTGILAIGTVFKMMMDIRLASFEGIFIILFWLLGMIFLIRSLYGLFYKSAIAINKQQIRFTSSSIFGTSRKTWLPDQIDQVYIKKDGYTNDNLYYSLYLEDNQGECLKMGEAIRGYSVAKSIGGYLKKKIELK